jgi:hypothetical protein
MKLHYFIARNKYGGIDGYERHVFKQLQTIDSEKQNRQNKEVQVFFVKDKVEHKSTVAEGLNE